MTTGRRVLLVLALVALLLGLGNRSAVAPEKLPQLDVLVAVDTTTSMSALDDPTGSRITAARRDLLALGRDFVSAQFALVTFDSDARVVLPFTSDQVAYADAVRNLQVQDAAAGDGSSISRVLSVLQTQTIVAAGQPDTIPVVVLVSDGEDTITTPVESFAAAASPVKASVVLGYGTAKGGVMPLRQVPVSAVPPKPAAAGPLVTDPTTGKPAVSHLDAGSLRTIAEQLGGFYVACNGQQDIGQVADRIQATAYADLSPGHPVRELRWLWALLVLLLALPELRLGWREFVEARREVRA